MAGNLMKRLDLKQDSQEGRQPFLGGSFSSWIRTQASGQASPGISWGCILIQAAYLSLPLYFGKLQRQWEAARLTLCTIQRSLKQSILLCWLQESQKRNLHYQNKSSSIAGGCYSYIVGMCVCHYCFSYYPCKLYGTRGWKHILIV